MGVAKQKKNDTRGRGGQSELAPMKLTWREVKSIQWFGPHPHRVSPNLKALCKNVYYTCWTVNGKGGGGTPRWENNLLLPSLWTFHINLLLYVVLQCNHLWGNFDLFILQAPEKKPSRGIHCAVGQLSLPTANGLTTMHSVLLKYL